MDVILYARASRDDQKLTCSHQTRQMLAYCEMHGHNVVKQYEEQGQSGGKLDRPLLQQALRELKDGVAAGLLIYKLDRLCRSLKAFATLVESHFGPTAKRPSALISTSEHIDTFSPSGQLVLNVIMAVAEWELATIRQRTKAALSEKRHRNEITGRLRYGYDEVIGADGVRRFVPNAHQQAGLDLMRHLRAQKRSFQQIADELMRTGYPPQHGGVWAPSVIRRILRKIELDQDAA